MSRRKHFSLLVVRGDGARILRLNFPRRLVTAAVAVVAVGLVVVTVLGVDWFLLRRVTREARPYADRIQEQQAALDTVNRKISELRREVAGWREIHGRVFDAFGPDGKPGPRDKGIGGPATPVEHAPARLSPSDELTQLAESIAEESQNLKALDRLMARAGKMLAALPTRWPVRGAVNSEFGTRQSPWTKAPEFHGGMDIRAERGTPVVAPAAGTVSFAGWHGEYGNTIILDHGNDIRTIYGHLSKTGVQAGERVTRGAQIGQTGNTGRSSGPHLHYEILVKGQPVNPRGFLWD
ncbi:MAG: M23 family metallopeptidase [Candidatus Rokubacteria bacterium]|nr:M23 family metallopeptidase [Candidatus Rokubacteria bacterium]